MPIPLAHAALDPLPESLRPLAMRGVVERYRKGRILIEEGQLGDTLYIILSGRLRAFARGERDREITYGIYGPGEYVGEMSLDGGRRSATVVTLETSDCVIVTRHSLLLHIGEHPEFALELLAKVIRRARAATLSAKQLALNDVYGRLKGLLEALVTEQELRPTSRVELPTHRAMAGQLGCSREMVSRLMKDLEHGGYLDIGAAGLALRRPLPPRW